MASASSSFVGTENPLSEGGVWTQPTAYWQPMRKATGLAGVVVNNDGAMRYTGATFTADHYSEMTLALIPNPPTTLWYHYLFARMNATAGTYQLTTGRDVGANILQLWKISDSGVYTQIGADITTPSNLVAGDVVRLEVTGTTLTCKVNGTTVRTATDSTFATGQPGIGGWYSSSGSSNVAFTSAWAAADITAAVSAPPFRPRNPSYQLLM